MEEPEVNLKDPWLAALLAFLIPGLGHLYQGRLFKAAVYSVCILSLFAGGMFLSNGKIVQAPTDRPGTPRSKTFSFAAQAGVGLPALYAFYQAKRYNNGAGLPVTQLSSGEEFVAAFSGVLRQQQGNDDLQDEVSGTIKLAGAQGRFGDPTLVGRFDGANSRGEAVEIILGEGTQLGPILRADRQRFVYAPVMDTIGENARRLGTLEGSVPRKFLDWFEAPLSEDEEQDLHRELGKLHELALVFTWIAGLLNLLAIWDALEGPAYGYGLADDDNEQDVEAPPSAANEPAAAAAAAAEPSPTQTQPLSAD